jgi:uncharacterized protein (TIGR00661 family)
MNQPGKENNLRKPRILVVPLDWGLGHATRCIPIIRELVKQHCEVWLAGEGPQQKLLQQEFPQLPFLQLAGYRVHYAESAIGLVLSIIRQTNKIFRVIRKENSWLKQRVKEHEFDAVISDNRYGLYHAAIPCIFITHQLTIKSPLGKWTEKILQKRNYKYINRFTECWVPDTAGENNLSGELSHPVKKPSIPVTYLGSLSRLQKMETAEKKEQLLIILSGPEPQRSILENKIIAAVSHHNGTATVVRGLPSALSMIPSTNMIRFYNHLPAEELNQEMMQAEYVISRCGYSTVMDLVQLQKKSILIPTPGQPEQEYLARYLSQKKIAYCMPQKEFSLTIALQKARQFPYALPYISNENKLEKIILEFVSSLKKQ